VRETSSQGGRVREMQGERGVGSDRTHSYETGLVHMRHREGGIEGKRERESERDKRQ